MTIATALRTFVRTRWRLRIWLVVAIGFGLGAGQIPLAGTLGFELAFYSSMLVAAAGLDLGGALARELMVADAAADGGQRPALWRGCLAASGLAVALALVPAVVCVIRGLWTPTCDWAFGLAAYAALPLATAALAGAFGHALRVIAGPSRRAAVAIVVVPYLALVAAALWRLYAAPPVFSYSPLGGYFPGNLYDENVQLHAPLLWSRLEQLLWVIGIAAAASVKLDRARYRVRRAAPRSRAAAMIAALAICGGIAMHEAGGTLGYAIDAGDVEAELAGTIETPHFIIHYAHTPEIDRDIALIASDHELRYAQVVAQIGAAPPGKLTSFYFADRDQKARWMGARDVEMAKPWRHEIYVDHRAFPHSSLRHEIAHAVASAFGDPVFGVAAARVAGLPLAFNPGLIEGLAVALDWPGGYDQLTPHEAVHVMAALGIEPSVDDLMSLRFFELSSTRSYTTAGSFLRYLLDTYGAAKLRAVYANGGDFEAAYGVPRAQLTDGWRAMIAKLAVAPDVIEAQRERFRGTGVWARPCAHAIAAAREDALVALAGGHRPAAIALLREVCSAAPEEPRHRLELGDALVGGAPDERDEALALWRQLADDAQITSSMRIEAHERLARAAGASGDLAGVRAQVDQARALDADANARRQLDAEQLALADTSPTGDALRAYFFPRQGNPISPQEWALIAVVANPLAALPHYLLGLQRIVDGNWHGSAAELARALELGLPATPFVRNAARKLALAAYRDGDDAGVERAAAILSGPTMSTVDHLLADDWRARLRFAKTGTL